MRMSSASVAAVVLLSAAACGSAEPESIAAQRSAW